MQLITTKTNNKNISWCLFNIHLTHFCIYMHCMSPVHLFLYLNQNWIPVIIWGISESTKKLFNFTKGQNLKALTWRELLQSNTPTLRCCIKKYWQKNNPEVCKVAPDAVTSEKSISFFFFFFKRQSSRRCCFGVRAFLLTFKLCNGKITHVWIITDWICLLKLIHVISLFHSQKSTFPLFRWVHILSSHYKVIKCSLSWVFVAIPNICSGKALRWVEDVTNNTSWRRISHSGIEYCCCCSN